MGVVDMDNPGGLMLGFGCMMLCLLVGIAAVVSAAKGGRER